MLRKLDAINPTLTLPERLVALDRARTFMTLLVLLHHSVVNYTYFGQGDPKRWLGFDLVVLFNDSFFMACMFLISGLFVWDSLTRTGTLPYLRRRAIRLGVPYLVSVFVLMPIAYYPTFLRYHLPGTSDFNFLHFWWRTLTVGLWPSGPAWFLWVLLALDAITAAVFAVAPALLPAFGRLIFAARKRPLAVFFAFLAVSILCYLPLHLAFGDGSWLQPGRFPLPIQTSRILLYAAYFFAGIGVGAVSLKAGLLKAGGALARLWRVWLAIALMFYGAILALVYVHHNWITDFDSPPLSWRTAYGVAFASFSAAMAFAVPAFFLRTDAAWLQLLDRLRPSAYGIYLVHYIFIIWLQYAVYDLALSAGIKFAIVFAATLSISWGVTVMLRSNSLVARII